MMNIAVAITALFSGIFTFQGRQDNLAVREAAIFALMFNGVMVVMAIISMMLTVPKGKYFVN